MPIYLGGEMKIVELSPNTPGGKPRVLIMDDEESIREVLQILLPRQGFDVTTVADGLEAVESYKAARTDGCPYAIVILDLTVPGGVGGKEALALLRSLDPQVRAIVVSGHAGGKADEEFRSMGFTDAVAKPFQVQDLADVIRRNLL